MRKVFGLLLVIPLVAPAWARTSSDDEYGPTDKLSRGVANITTGVLAFPGTIVDKTREDGASGVPIGIGMGLVNTVARELVGVYDLVTFPLPQPHNYAPALSPAYPWQYFTESGEVREAEHRTRERTAAASSRTANEVRETAHETRDRVESAEQNATVRDSDIRRVQRKLNDMGYQAGPVDGVYGPRTRDAVRAFQRDKNLHASGRIDHDTLAAMDVNVRGTESPTAGTR